MWAGIQGTACRYCLRQGGGSVSHRRTFCLIRCRRKGGGNIRARTKAALAAAASGDLVPITSLMDDVSAFVERETALALAELDGPVAVTMPGGLV